VAAQIIPQQAFKAAIQTPQYNQQQAPSIITQQSGNSSIDQSKIINPAVINISPQHP